MRDRELDAQRDATPLDSERREHATGNRVAGRWETRSNALCEACVSTQDRCMADQIRGPGVDGSVSHGALLRTQTSVSEDCRRIFRAAQQMLR